MAGWNCGRWATLSAVLAMSAPVCIQPVNAAQDPQDYVAAAQANAQAIQVGAMGYANQGRGYWVRRYGRATAALQCVPFARANSGIELIGNAVTWWRSAVGVYERGNRPEVGSVLNFRSTGRMSLGHVAVVTRVVDSRNIEIDHANWVSRGAISRHVNVVDASPQNDWTAVRVALVQGTEFGSIYPTFGFIYDRPDHGTMIANIGAMPALAVKVQADGPRLTGDRIVAALANLQDQEVAEASDDAQPRTRRAWSARLRNAQVFHGSAMQGVSAQAQSAAKAPLARRGRPST